MKKLVWSAVLLMIAFQVAISMALRMRVTSHRRSTIAAGMTLGHVIITLGTPDHIEDRDSYYWVCWKNAEVLVIRLNPYSIVTTYYDKDANEYNVKPWRGFQTEVK